MNLDRNLGEREESFAFERISYSELSEFQVSPASAQIVVCQTSPLAPRAEDNDIRRVFEGWQVRNSFQGSMEPSQSVVTKCKEIIRKGTHREPSTFVFHPILTVNSG